MPPSTRELTPALRVLDCLQVAFDSSSKLTNQDGRSVRICIWRERAGDVEKGAKEQEVLCPPHVDCAEARNKFSATVLIIIDAVLETFQIKGRT